MNLCVSFSTLTIFAVVTFIFHHFISSIWRLNTFANYPYMENHEDLKLELTWKTYLLWGDFFTYHYMRI